jgi:hypothetical protein
MGRKREEDDDDYDDLSPAPGYVEPPSKWETKPVSKKVQRIFDALEITMVHPEVRSMLQRWTYRHDKYGMGVSVGDITLLCRTIIESEGNADALSEPIIVSAVHSCMRDQWTNKGLAWIEAFDKIPLCAILETLRSLEFSEGEIRQHYSVCLRRKLWKIFGPDVVLEQPKVEPLPKPQKARQAARQGQQSKGRSTWTRDRRSHLNELTKLTHQNLCG